MEAPKFTVGQKVKFSTDHDGHAGVIEDMTWSASEGYRYTISSRYFDSAINDMVVGHKICREDELLDMSPEAIKAREDAAKANNGGVSTQ